MDARARHLPALLRRLFGTAPFRDYCAMRGLPHPSRDITAWEDQFARLPPEQQAQAELDLAEVHTLSGRDGNAHLLAAAGDTLPLTVPGGPALALWFLVHRPAVFTAVYLHHEVRAVRAWRSARLTPGKPIGDIPGKTDTVADRLREFFGVPDGGGRFCAIESHWLDGTLCLTAHVADRVRLIDTFTDGGHRSLARLRPAAAVVFSYRTSDGTVRVRSPLRSPDRIVALLCCFTEPVLGERVYRLDTLYHLDRLKRPFAPLPDAPDMEFVRLKALHLRYPGRLGLRQVKFETLRSDAPGAVAELLAAHAGSGIPDDELRVAYAELQVRLRERRGPRDHLIRLWPDRSSLSHNPLHDRLRRCLRRWNLTDYD